MKKMRYLFHVVVFACAFLLFGGMRVEAADTEVTLGNYTYVINSAGASIKSYNGSETSVTIPETVTYDGMSYKIRKIGASAFSGNKYLQKVVIPAQITQMGNCVFKNCINLEEVVINGDIADLSEYSNRYDDDCAVFYNAGSNSDGITVTFGPEVTKIPAYLFATARSKSDGSYANVIKVLLSDSVKEIGRYAFYNCYNLSNIAWGSSLTTIRSEAFANCSTIKEVILPQGTTTIGDKVFANCSLLTKIELPKSVTQLGNCVFENCINLEEVVINGDIADLSEYSNRYDDDYAVFYNAGSNSDGITVTFGSEVTRIPAYLFATARSKSDGTYAHVTKVKADSVKEIGKYAFYNCHNLKEISVGKNLYSIGTNAFTNCSNVVIYGPMGGYVESYANNIGADFVGIVIVEDYFADVVDNEWYVSYIQFAYDNNIMQGAGTNAWGRPVFKPNDNIPREQFVQVLYNASGQVGTTTTSSFNDVPRGQWYTNAVAWAAENGITSGYEDGRFGVGDNITREQLVTMLYKYAVMQGYDVNRIRILNPAFIYQDWNAVSEWATDQMNWAAAIGIISGKPQTNGTVHLDPRATATRAECATMINNFYAKYLIN